MERDSHMVTANSKGGAKVEDVTDMVKNLKDNDDRHLVLVAGTNNIQQDGSEILLEKFKKLLETSKSVRNRKVTVVEVLKRMDVDSFVDSRRIGVNVRLKQMCESSGAEFVEFKVGKSRISRDGVHLHERGQNELGRVIFTHCKTFLA